jgi:hypothetical protein
MRRLQGMAVVAGGLACLSAVAQNSAQSTAHLGLATQPVTLPGAGQIVVVFLFVAALAVGLAAALRRVSPHVLRRWQPPSGSAVTLLARQSLEPGASLHIVSVDGERLAIVTGRSGVAVYSLSAAGTRREDASDATPAGNRR